MSAANKERRKFMGAAAALLVMPEALLAQKLRRIGVLTLSVSSSEQAQFGKLLFSSMLRDAGYEDGRNLTIEWRYAEGDASRLPALAQELVRLNVEVIVASFNDAIAAARDATRSIPIVMISALSPVELGFVASLARPGGNVTGTAWSAPETAGKILEVLKDAAPRATRVAFLGNPAVLGMKEYGASTERVAAALGISTRHFGATRPEEIAPALERIAVYRPQALYVAFETMLLSGIRDIVAFALKRKLPSIANAPQFTDAGGLLYYGPDLNEIGARSANYVARILGGVKPAELPVELPNKYRLVVNAKTAKAIGHKISPTFLMRADRVIE